jgi:hypothetical protein
MPVWPVGSAGAAIQKWKGRSADVAAAQNATRHGSICNGAACFDHQLGGHWVKGAWGVRQPKAGRGKVAGLIFAMRAVACPLKTSYHFQPIKIVSPVCAMFWICKPQLKDFDLIF